MYTEPASVEYSIVQPLSPAAVIFTCDTDETLSALPSFIDTVGAAGDIVSITIVLPPNPSDVSVFFPAAK